MLAYRFVGKKFTILSCISIVVVSVLVDLLPVTPITGDILLISVFGGIINGLGMSLILNNNASSGGKDFIAMTYPQNIRFLPLITCCSSALP